MHVYLDIFIYIDKYIHKKCVIFCDFLGGNKALCEENNKYSDPAKFLCYVWGTSEHLFVELCHFLDCHFPVNYLTC
jgi:hypothetical protein